MDLPDTLTRPRIIPVVVLHDASKAPALADALVAGNLPVAEVTLRTPAGLDSIRAIAGRDDILVGAGTVTTPEQVDAVADAGAKFIVSPGFSSAVVERAQQRGVPVVPGCVTPSEIMAALEAGLTTVKFFPASTYGGAKAIKALAAPFGGVSFVPTGGVSTDNLAEYLSLPFVPAVGGSWMVPADLVDAGDFETITHLSTQAVAAAAAIK